MTRFSAKGLLFSLPLLCIYLFPLFVLLLSGELLSVRAIVDRQQHNAQDILYGSAFTADTERPYKLLSTVQKNPEVLALGTSRVLTMKSDFFKDGKVFYNAGRGVRDAGDLMAYLQSIPENSNVKIILLDLSNLLFESPEVNGSVDRSGYYDMFRLFLTYTWHEVYLDYAIGKFSLSDLIRQSRTSHDIGLDAMINHKGYRKDGSYSWGDTAHLIEMRNELSRQIFNAADAVSTTSEPRISQKYVAELGQFIALASERHLYVIGYLSPYASSVYKKQESLNDPDGRFRMEPTILGSILGKYGYHFYDLRDGKTIGSSDDELYDPFHYTEKASIKLLVYLAGREPKLTPYVGVVALKNQLNSERF